MATLQITTQLLQTFNAAVVGATTETTRQSVAARNTILALDALVQAVMLHTAALTKATAQLQQQPQGKPGPSPAPPTPPVGQVGTQTSTGVGAVVGSIAGALSGAVGQLVGAMQPPIEAFQRLTGAIIGFVGALNPTAVQQFSLAMRDLSATIGVALQPFLQAATTLARELASSLLPVMQQLQPIFADVAQSLIQIGVVYVQAAASILQSLIPAFKFLAGVLDAVIPLIQGFYAAIAGLVEAVVGLVRSVLKGLGVNTDDLLGGIKSAFQQLTTLSLLLTASLLKLVDAVFATTLSLDFIKGVRRAFGEGEKGNATGIAAPQNAGIGGFGDFANKIATAAFLAGPGGGTASKEDQFRSDVLKQLDQLVANQPTLVDKVVETLDRLVEKLVDRLIIQPGIKATKAPFEFLPGGDIIAKAIFG